MNQKSVHIFNRKGHSVLSYEFLCLRIKLLEKENESLKRLLQAQARREQARQETDSFKN